MVANRHRKGSRAVEKRVPVLHERPQFDARIVAAKYIATPPQRQVGGGSAATDALRVATVHRATLRMRFPSVKADAPCRIAMIPSALSGDRAVPGNGHGCYLSKPFHSDMLREILNRFGVHPRSAPAVSRTANGADLPER